MRRIATKAVEDFKTNFEQIRGEIQALKKEVFRVRILAQQIQAVEDDNQAMERAILGDDTNLGFALKPSDIRPGPRKPGPPRDEGQAAKDLPEEDEDETEGK